MYKKEIEILYCSILYIIDVKCLIYFSSFLQESTESANTTIEDEDLKGKVQCLLASLPMCLSVDLLLAAVVSPQCVLHTRFSSTTRTPFLLYIPPPRSQILPVAERSILPFLHSLFISLLQGVCFSISCGVCYFEMCSFSFVLLLLFLPLIGSMYSQTIRKPQH